LKILRSHFSDIHDSQPHLQLTFIAIIRSHHSSFAAVIHLSLSSFTRIHSHHSQAITHSQLSSLFHSQHSQPSFAVISQHSQPSFATIIHNQHSQHPSSVNIQPSFVTIFRSQLTPPPLLKKVYHSVGRREALLSRKNIHDPIQVPAIHKQSLHAVNFLSFSNLCIKLKIFFTRFRLQLKFRFRKT
jgi:hypothetical protein